MRRRSCAAHVVVLLSACGPVEMAATDTTSTSTGDGTTSQADADTTAVTPTTGDMLDPCECADPVVVEGDLDVPGLDGFQGFCIGEITGRLRIEDVEPSDAFAYELSTRQWIDAFASWDKSIDALVTRIGQIAAVGEPRQAAPQRAARRHRAGLSGRAMAAAAALVLLCVVAGGAWLFQRPSPAAAHSMMVRLTGFSSLSADVPAGTPGAMRDEIIAAFNDDGVVGVSTATAPPQGPEPAYALGGTIRRDGDKIKVNVLLTNERSGATLWSNIFSYDSDQLSRVPRHIAVDAGNMVRCGLFAASTYREALVPSETVAAGEWFGLIAWTARSTHNSSAHSRTRC